MLISVTTNKIHAKKECFISSNCFYVGKYINDYSKGFKLQLHKTPKPTEESEDSSKVKWEHLYTLDGEWDLGSNIFKFADVNKCNINATRN